MDRACDHEFHSLIQAENINHDEECTNHVAIVVCVLCGQVRRFNKDGIVTITKQRGTIRQWNTGLDSQQ